MIKVLIIGLGSIGQRHAKALHSLNIENIAALRTNRGQKEIDPKLDNILFFYSEEEAFNWQPTHLIISNPTSLHIEYIKKAIDKGIKFFVEKPIANDLQEVLALSNHANINGVVGYNLRFHGIFKHIRSIINNGTYGNVITAQLHVGQYLPNWHPYEDYRKAYYARKDLGGGALKTLSHEIDIMQYLFGKVNSVFAKVQKNSTLEIDVDDVTNIIANTENCPQVVVNINFLDPKIKREGRIYFEKGVLEYDYVKSKVIFIENNGKEKHIELEKEDINSQYLNQMHEFIFENNIKLACSFEEGIAVMNIIENCMKSNNEKKEICLV